MSEVRGHFEGGTRGNAVPIVGKLPDRTGTAFPLIKCFNNALLSALRTIFRPKCTTLQYFCMNFSKLLNYYIYSGYPQTHASGGPGGDPLPHPLPARKHPGCLYLDTNFRSVPTVPVLRNDQRGGDVFTRSPNPNSRPGQINRYQNSVESSLSSADDLNSLWVVSAPGPIKVPRPLSTFSCSITGD